MGLVETDWCGVGSAEFERGGGGAGAAAGGADRGPRLYPSDGEAAGLCDDYRSGVDWGEHADPAGGLHPGQRDRG